MAESCRLPEALWPRRTNDGNETVERRRTKRTREGQRTTAITKGRSYDVCSAGSMAADGKIDGKRTGGSMLIRRNLSTTGFTDNSSRHVPGQTGMATKTRCLANDDKPTMTVTVAILPFWKTTRKFRCSVFGFVANNVMPRHAGRFYFHTLKKSNRSTRIERL